MRLIQLTPIGGVAEIITDIFAKNILGLPKVGRASASLAQWCTSNFFMRTRLGKKISGSTGRLFPLGYFLIAEKP
jgi:hypothetical protein